MKFDEIFEGDKNKMIALSVCRAADPEVLEPILRIIEEKGVRCHLVDDRGKLETMLASYEADHLLDGRITIHHVGDDHAAAMTSLELISTGQANVLMKGLISTSVLLKEVLNKKYGLVHDSLLSHVALFDMPRYHKAILLSDAGMNITPSIEDKKKIIDNTLECARQLSADQPKVALLAAVEKVSDKMPATAEAEALAHMDVKNFKYNCTIEGPLQYDLAISKAAADHKGIRSTVAGDVDILIAPGIEAGNILYKSLVYSAGASVASIIMGASVPIVLTSRADSAEDRYNSINLAMKISK
ncbi:phosphate acyltransferase [Salinicoccus hispanicus]|uniref:Phosphate butyryltransferase n=1 Tax=Salinicoccus hispanicus TaxID=157225 RepID=A0A6N8U3G7_9STAP|nr:phosphate acyltransferase [Salinicoccus hispanicus]MXQ50229.1 phosphate butyryltransferase [Salinicoccus hispanicus]